MAAGRSEGAGTPMNRDGRQATIMLAAAQWLALLSAVAAPVSTGAKSVFLVAMLLAVLASGRLTRILQVAYRQPLGKMLLALTAWLVVGLFHAPTLWPVRIHALEAWLVLPLAFVVLGLYDRVAAQRRFACGYALAMIAWALVSLWLWVAHRNPRGQGNGIVMITYTAQSIAFVAAVFACVWLATDRSWHRALRPVAWAGIALLVFNIAYVSSSRTGLVALAAAVVVIGSLRLRPGRRLMVLAAAGLLMLVFVSTSSIIQKRFGEAAAEFHTYRTSPVETSIGMRMVLYANTWGLILRNPVLGYGTSSFGAVYTPYAAARSGSWQGQPMTDAHCQYLYVWMENGIVGLLLLLGLIVVGVRQGLGLGPAGLVAAGFLTTVAISSLCNSHFRSLAEGYQLAFIVGALAARTLDDRVEGVPPQRSVDE